MAETSSEITMPEEPDISHIITEDDTPVDNIFSEKQQRLLSETLNGSWKPGRSFVAASNVGIFYAIKQPPVVPDTFISLDVELPEDLWPKKNRSYFVWEYGKPPEVVVEVVSNKKGGELDKKIQKYQQMRVYYYIIYDPQHFIQKEELRIWELSPQGYIPKADRNLIHIGLGVTLWDGEYERYKSRWLRWRDQHGNIIKTGVEIAEETQQRADQEQQRADQEQQRADQEQQRADQEQQRADQEQQRADQEQQRTEKEKERAVMAEQKVINTVSKMIARGYDLDEISELIDLSVEEIQSLAEG